MILYEGQDFATEQIESVLNYSGKALSANKEILDDYQESYQTFLQMDMVANEKLFSVDYDKSKKSYGQLYEDYADAVEKRYPVGIPLKLKKQRHHLKECKRQLIPLLEVIISTLQFLKV